MRFSASGREDVDVRTLGRGRPFVAELADPHVTLLSAERLLQLQRDVNAAHPEIRVRDLQLVTRSVISNAQLVNTSINWSACASDSQSMMMQSIDASRY